MKRYSEEYEMMSDRPDLPDPLPAEITFEEGERALYYKTEEGAEYPSDNDFDVEPEEVVILWAEDERDDLIGFREAKVHRVEAEGSSQSGGDFTKVAPLYRLEKIGSQKAIVRAG
jgi:hypothetical protein